MKQEARIEQLSVLDGISLDAVAKRLGLKRKDIARALNVSEGAVSLGFNDPGGGKQHRAEMRKSIIGYLADYEQMRNTKKPKRNLPAA